MHTQPHSGFVPSWLNPSVQPQAAYSQTPHQPPPPPKQEAPDSNGPGQIEDHV
jgi:hypothetical protein